jgi:hypothetical protein
MRWKARPTLAAVREELAADAEARAEVYSDFGSPDFAAITASCRKRAQEIRDGAEIRIAAWELPAWARGGFAMYDFVVLGEDNILRPDPRFSGS